MLKVNYAEDTRPVTSIVLTQPEGTLDLTINKNAKGSRLRISNRDGNVVNVDTSKLPLFIEALNRVAKHGTKTSQRSAA